MKCVVGRSRNCMHVSIEQKIHIGCYKYIAIGFQININYIEEKNYRGQFRKCNVKHTQREGLHTGQRIVT